ncbi:MAG: hypothetical protein QNJ44_19670 [Rhodobacter sp.]|nr:hypothetical protein [Rhodobacter sp.]
MDFKLGRTTFTTKSAWRHPDYLKLRLGGSPRLGLGPRHVFNWDCALRRLHPAPPRYFTVGPNLAIIALNPDGTADPAGARKKARLLLKAAELRNEKELTEALFKAFPLFSVPVPLAKIFRQFPRDVIKFLVVAWVIHRDLMAVPVGGSVEQAVILSYPQCVTFDVIEIARCLEELNPVMRHVTFFHDILGNDIVKRLRALDITDSEAYAKDEGFDPKVRVQEIVDADTKRRTRYAKLVQKVYR